MIRNVETPVSHVVNGESLGVGFSVRFTRRRQSLETGSSMVASGLDRGFWREKDFPADGQNVWRCGNFGFV